MGFLLSFLVIFCLEASAVPAQIIVLRHAEKPATKSDDLSPAGFARAEALAQAFAQRPELQEFGHPVALYASTYTPGQSSDRPVETIQPTAKALGLEIDQRYSKGDEAALIHEILSTPAYDGKMVVITWTHSTIQELAYALGVQDVPAHWPGHVFDRFWIFTFGANGQIDFQNRAQHLMPGDSAT